MPRRRSMVVLGAVLALAACAEPPTEPATTLAPAPADPTGSALRYQYSRLHAGPGRAYGVNNKGQVVGYYRPTGLMNAFLWSNGVLRNLGSLGGGISEANAINEAGQIVGSSSLASGEYHGFLWQNGTMRDLGTLGPNRSTATAINATGQVAGFTWSIGGTSRAFMWQNGSMKRLAGLGTGFSMANGIDKDGRVVGVYGDPNAPRAFLWTNGIVTNLGSAGVAAATASDIGSGGKVAGWVDLTSGAQHAVLWQNGVRTDLGTLGGAGSRANSINGLGHVTGWSQQADGLGYAFIRKDGAMTTIARGEAHGSNRDGTVVGAMTTENGFSPVVWRLTDQPPPPPGRITLGSSFFQSDRNASIDPAVDTVSVGAEVTWIWSTGPAVPHSVQSVGAPSFPSSAVTGGVGLTYKVKFTKAGLYRYNCSRHPGNMTGRVLVQ